MKGIDIFCASQDSTAISSSMEHVLQPSSSTSSASIGGRAIDRHNPIIRDSRRIAKSLAPCNTPQSPISPKPNKNQPQKKKSSAHKVPLKENYSEIKKSDSSININKAEIVDVGKNKKKESEAFKNEIKPVRRSWSCTRPGGFISPTGSTRYLLGDDDKVPVSDVSNLESKMELFDEVESKLVINKAVKAEKQLDLNEVFQKTSPDVYVSPDQPQVVVLRVSLHCRGCERKMRKHISRMEGVTSFNIDFMAKKVTVEGNVTPLGVLASISKVKNAQLWSPTISSTTPASVHLNSSGPIKNKAQGVDAKVGDKEGVFLSMVPQIKLV